MHLIASGRNPPGAALGSVRCRARWPDRSEGRVSGAVVVTAPDPKRPYAPKTRGGVREFSRLPDAHPSNRAIAIPTTKTMNRMFVTASRASHLALSEKEKRELRFGRSGS